MTVTEAKAKLVATAKAEVGYRESYNNWVKYSDDPNITKLYGWTPQNQPWCGTFANWCYMKAFGYNVGSKLTYGGSAACATAAQLFKSAGAWSSFPEVGDQAFFLSGGGINHTGIVVSVEGTSFIAVEGNYSDKVSSVRHNIGASDVAGFGRPRWDLVKSQKQGNLSSNDGKTDGKEQKPDKIDEDHSWTPPLLRQSDRYKPDVVVLQALLNVKGFFCGEADGYYGAKTATAVSRAQHFYQIEVDCVCGKQTWGKLLETG